LATATQSAGVSSASVRVGMKVADYRLLDGLEVTTATQAITQTTTLPRLWAKNTICYRFPVRITIAGSV
jgi:hypothetical protein